MKKQISKTLIFILMLQIVAPLFLNRSYAEEKDSNKCEENPPICSATQPRMETYLKFQKEMAALLSTNKFKKVTESVEEGKGGLFTSKLLTLSGAEDFNETLAAKALRIFDITATRSATSILTSLFLFELAAIGALADNTIGLTILFQDRPIVRDWTKLLDVEWGLTETAYDLGVVGDIGRKIKDTSALDDVLTRYVGEGLFQDGATFGSDVPYMNIIMQLAELNSAIKRFIAYDSKAQINSYNENYSSLKLDEKWIKDLDQEYKCARFTFGFKCSKSRSNLVKNLRILTNNTNKQGKSSVKQIKDSYTALKSALGNWGAVKDRLQGKDISENSLSERERELLRSRYGLDADRLTRAEGSSLISLNSNIKSKWNSLAKGVKTAVADFKGAVDSYTEYSKEMLDRYRTSYKKYLDSKTSNDTYIGDRISKMYGRDPKTGKVSEFDGSEIYEYISGQIEKVNNSQKESYSIVNASNNMVLNRGYVQLLDKVEELIEKIGDKDKGLRSSLRSLCTRQCSNKGNECCYVK